MGAREASPEVRLSAVMWLGARDKLTRRFTTGISAATRACACLGCGRGHGKGPSEQRTRRQRTGEESKLSATQGPLHAPPTPWDGCNPQPPHPPTLLHFQQILPSHTCEAMADRRRSWAPREGGTGHEGEQGSGVGKCLSWGRWAAAAVLASWFGFVQHICDS